MKNNYNPQMNKEDFMNWLEWHFPLIDWNEDSSSNYYGGEYCCDYLELKGTKLIFLDEGVSIKPSNFEKEEDLIKALTNLGLTYIDFSIIGNVNCSEYNGYIIHSNDRWCPPSPRGDVYPHKKGSLQGMELTGEDLILECNPTKLGDFLINPAYNMIDWDEKEVYNVKVGYDESIPKLYYITPKNPNLNLPNPKPLTWREIKKMRGW